MSLLQVLVVISSGEDDCFSRCLVSEEVCTCSGDLIDKVNKKNDEIAILTGGRRVMILPVVLSEYDKIPVSGKCYQCRAQGPPTQIGCDTVFDETF